MQQRVALARALANEPAVLLLDEPLGALDRKLRDEMQRELRRVQAELGATFIYVTHDQDEAFGMADRLAVMRDGRFEQIGRAGRQSMTSRPMPGSRASSAAPMRSAPASSDAARRPVLRSDFGPVEAGYLADGLAAGDAALVAGPARGDPFRAGRPGADRRAQPLRGAAADTVAIGPSLRLRAVTAGRRRV